MNKLFAVLCSLLMVIAISGAGIANGDTSARPSANQNQIQPNGAMEPSEMGETGAGPMDAEPESTGAIEGAGPRGMYMCPMGSIAVDNDSIYILRGDQLLRYNKSDMRLMGTTTLPSPTQPITPATPGAAGQGPTICPSTSQGTAACPPSITGAGPAPVAMRTDLTPRPSYQQMAQSMEQMSPADLEKAYLQAMIQSHCGAIDWSNLAKSKASRSDLRRFAGRIADNESQMSMRFSNQLRSWYSASSKNCEKAMPMDDEVLNHLQTLSGRDFDIAYMQAMITHFSETITLSQEVQQRAAHPELQTDAANIINSNTANIQQLRTWAADWYGVSI